MGSLLLVVACDSSKDSFDTSVSTEEALNTAAATLQDFVTTYSNNSALPLPITGDSSTGYVVATDGTVSLGMTPSSMFWYGIDPGNLYGAESTVQDQPTHLVAGSKDDSYDGNTGDTQISVSSAVFIGNGEEHKDDTYAGIGYPFVDEFPFGSVYVQVATVGSGQQACRPQSFVRPVSSYAQEQHPYFVDTAALTTQAATSQLDDPDWPSVAAQKDPDIAEAYYRNIAGSFTSHHFDDSTVYKQEYGMLAQRVDYEPPLLVANLPNSFTDVNPTPCVRVFESDDPLGATPFVQTRADVSFVLGALESAGEPTAYRMIIAHDLNNENQVYQAYCAADEDEALSDRVDLTGLPTEAGVVDASAELCPNPDWPNMSQVELVIEK